MASSQTRIVVTVDDVYASRCESKFKLYPAYHRPQTLDDFARAFRVFTRDTEMTRLQLEWRLAELRDEEERGRALTCVTPLPFMNRD